MILIDSGSTHIFIVKKVVKEVKVVLKRTTILAIIATKKIIMKCNAYIQNSHGSWKDISFRLT
jgi:hypothetical protein